MSSGLRSVIIPVCWRVCALIGGAFVDDRFGDNFYPYPFMDVQVHGYAVALFRCAIVAVLFLVLAFGALALNRRLGGVRKVATA